MERRILIRMDFSIAVAKFPLKRFSSLLGTFSDTLYGLVGSIIFGLAHGFEYLNSGNISFPKKDT